MYLIFCYTDLKYIETAAGTRLLISGWWGASRHINYLGDWLMSIAWCLPCGYATPIPYFYAIYFAVLLLHRQLRDDDKCRKKYGKDWERYCEIVKWRIIPGRFSRILFVERISIACIPVTKCILFQFFVGIY